MRAAYDKIVMQLLPERARNWYGRNRNRPKGRKMKGKRDGERDKSTWNLRFSTSVFFFRRLSSRFRCCRCCILCVCVFVAVCFLFLLMLLLLLLFCICYALHLQRWLACICSFDRLSGWNEYARCSVWPECNSYFNTFLEYADLKICISFPCIYRRVTICIALLFPCHIVLSAYHFANAKIISINRCKWLISNFSSFQLQMRDVDLYAIACYIWRPTFTGTLTPMGHSINVSKA